MAVPMKPVPPVIRIFICTSIFAHNLSIEPTLSSKDQGCSGQNMGTAKRMTTRMTRVNTPPILR